MREVSFKVYDIDELSEEAREKAINELREGDDFFWEVRELVDSIEKASEFFNFEVTDYEVGLYSRSYIEVSNANYMELSNEEKNELVKWLRDNIESGADGSCPFTGVYYDCFFFDYFIRHGVEVTYNNLHKEVSNALEYQLDRGVEALEEEHGSDERYIEEANANEIEFYEDGRVYNGA